MDRSDRQLVDNYLKGDEASLELLIRRYLGPIYGFAYRRVGNAQDAEDIAQEVFVKVWRSLKKPALSLSKGFDPRKGSFKAWIFSIARNTAIDFLKKKRLVPFSEFENGDGENALTETLVDPSPLPQELLEKSEIARILSAAIEILSPKYRMVLAPRYNDHLNFREIAESLGESLHTIKSRHRRALGMLKKLLPEL